MRLITSIRKSAARAIATAHLRDDRDHGARVDLNGALVVLSGELRSAAQVLRNSCATHAGLPQSNLVEVGRGDLPQDPDATLPALYIAGRDISPTSPAIPGPPPPIPAEQTTAR